MKMEKLDTKNMQARGGVWQGEVFLFSVAREQPTSIHGIAKYDPSVQQGSKLSLLSGSAAGYQEGQVSVAQFNNPASLCDSKDLGLIVADTDNHRVRSIQNDYVRTLAGSGMPGNQDGPSDFSQLNFPSLLCDSSDYIIIAERNSTNKIRVFSRSTGRLTTVNISTGDMTASLIPTSFAHLGSDIAVCTPSAIYSMSIGPNTFTSNPCAMLKPHLVLGNRTSFNSVQSVNPSGDLLFSAASSIRVLTPDAQISTVNALTIPSSGAVPLIAVSERNNAAIIDLATGHMYVGVYNPYAANDSLSYGLAATSLSGKFGQDQGTQNTGSQQYPPSAPQSSSTPTNPPQGYNSMAPWENQQAQGQATQPQNAQNSQMGYNSSAPSSDAPPFDPSGYYSGGGNRGSYPASQTGSNPAIAASFAMNQPPLSGSPVPSSNPYASNPSNPSPYSSNPQNPTQDGSNPYGQYPTGFPPQLSGTSTPGQSPTVSRGYDSPVQTAYGGMNQGQPQGYQPPTQTMSNPTIQAPPTMVTPTNPMGQPTSTVVMQGYPPQPTSYGNPYGTPVAVAAPIAVGTPVMGTPIAITSPVVAVSSPVVAVPAKQHHHHHHSGSSSKRETPSSSGLWEWESTNDVWNPYDMNIHNAIMAAYQNGQTKANFNINGIQYEIDFSNAPTRQVQVHNRSKTRRVRGPSQCPLPIIN